MKQIDQGIVLKRTNYSDSSVILTLLTRDHGLQRYIFQGGKKKASVLYPLSQVEFEFYKRPDSELGKLTSALANDPSSAIPQDPIRSSIAFFLTDVVLQTCKIEEADPPLYDHLIGLIDRVESGERLVLLPVYALVELTYFLGIQPSFSSDGHRVFLLDEGEFVQVPPSGSLSESGEHVDLIISMMGAQEFSIPSHEIRAKALSTMIRYYELFIPGFNVSRSLEILRETLS